MDENRRKFNKKILLGSIGYVLGTAIEEAVGTVIEEKFFSGNLEYENNVKLFKRFLTVEEGIKAHVGEGNMLAAMEKEGKVVSPYIKTAINGFAGFLKSANPYTNNFRVLSYRDEAFYNEGLKETLYLGGPVANKKSGKLIGYRYGGKLPQFTSETDLRWGFSLGDSDWGVHDGEKLTELRIDNDGQIVNRARYALVDNKKNDSFRKELFEVTEKGFAKEDCLIITKRSGKSRGEGDILSIGGCHGHSIKDFGSNLQEYFTKLDKSSKVGDDEYFQIKIPYALDFTKKDRFSGKPKTVATPIWERLEYEGI